MKASLETRALAACRDLVATKTEVESLGHLIGDALGRCFTDWYKAQPEWSNPTGHEPHLKAAYAPIIYEFEDETCYRDEAAIVAMLADCPHCLAAHKAIQERKVARRKLGAARRAVTIIGRAA